MKLFFLLASSLVYANASTSDGVEHSLLRGSTQDQEHQEHQEHQEQGLAIRRSLLDLNEMECKPDTISADGSIICSFRMYPPMDPDVGTIKHACTFVPPPFSRSMCLSAEVYRVNYNDLPEDHFEPTGPVVVLPAEPVVVLPAEPVVIAEPVVLPGDSTTDTVFIDVDASNLVLSPSQSPVVPPSQSPVVPPSQSPVGPPSQSPVGPPSQSPVGVSVVPDLPGRPDCPPAKPADFFDCSELDNVRCSYYNNILEPQSDGITNCDCTKDEGFRCRAATAFAFSF